MIRPTFNVSEPFQGITTIQMNGEMVKLLSNLLEEVTDMPEKELRAFKAALANPGKSREIREARWAEKNNEERTRTRCHTTKMQYQA